MESWNLGILESWNLGILESWNLGILESYHITAEYVIIEILLYRDIILMQHIVLHAII